MKFMMMIIIGVSSNYNNTDHTELARTLVQLIALQVLAIEVITFAIEFVTLAIESFWQLLNSSLWQLNSLRWHKIRRN